MRRLLVSGLTGFVGTNLSKNLGNSYSIIGLSRREEIKNEFIKYEHLSRETLDNSEAFIHLAGKAHDLRKVSSDSEYYKTNTDLTKQLFDKWLNSSCKIFIFLSSVKAVRDNTEEILTEDFNPTPKTVYGKSKLAAENYMISRFKEIPEGKHVYILRPCMIHGSNNKGNLNLLYGIIKKGIPYPLGAYDNKRSFLSVDNLCFIIDQLIAIKPQSGIYNVADDEAISTKNVVNIIGESINKRARILNVPKALINLGAQFGDIFPFFPLNSERLNKLTENYVVSNNKIRQTLKIQKSFSTREGIINTIKSFKL